MRKLINHDPYNLDNGGDSRCQCCFDRALNNGYCERHQPIGRITKSDADAFMYLTRPHA